MDTTQKAEIFGILGTFHITFTSRIQSDNR